MRDRSGTTGGTSGGVIAAGPQSRLAGLHVLAVEDESLVAMWLEDLLTDLGCLVVGPANTIAAALRLLDQQSVDAAILDINIAGEKVFPVADRLTALNVPFVFATGYGVSGVQEPHAHRPVIQKPYTMGTLQRALESVVVSS
jgi:CheY-like chemotaxis protein